MRCALCKSSKQAEFTSEMMIHFSGSKHLANPGVLVFPKVWVCLDCGSSRFTTPETEMRVLREGYRSVCGCLSSPLAVGGLCPQNADPTIHR
jgi:hypothetical protein